MEVKKLMSDDFATSSSAYATHGRGRASAYGAKMPITILRRPGGAWRPIEATLLCTHLNASIIGNPKHPEYLLLRGHFEKHETLPCMLDGMTYSVQKVSGLDSKNLPFIPGWR